MEYENATLSNEVVMTVDTISKDNGKVTHKKEEKSNSKKIPIDSESKRVSLAEHFNNDQRNIFKVRE